MKTLSLPNAKIVKRNFAGKPDRYNPAGGYRKFLVLLPPDLVQRLRDDGWNVKFFKADEGEIPDAFLEVKVSYDSQYPPKILQITSGNQTELDETTVAGLDVADIVKVDLIINGSQWHVNGDTGVKAYLKKMYVTIAEDEFEKQYRFDEPLPPPFDAN